VWHIGWFLRIFLKSGLHETVKFYIFIIIRTKSGVYEKVMWSLIVTLSRWFHDALFKNIYLELTHWVVSFLITSTKLFVAWILISFSCTCIKPLPTGDSSFSVKCIIIIIIITIIIIAGEFYVTFFPVKH
jgi:hypothetical protein